MVVFLLPSLVWAQQLEPLKDVRITTVVLYDSSSKIYTFEYTVSNSLSNSLSIHALDIDVRLPEDSESLFSEGLDNGASYLRYTSGRALSETPMVPVGMPSAPYDWIYGLSVNGEAGWGSSEESIVKPGEVLDGFVLTSYGIPGIRKAILEPDYIVDMEDVPDDAGDLYEYLDNIYNSIAYHTSTLGPTAPPAAFDAVRFIDYIISMKHEAASLGWITNKGIINSLDAKLENAKKAIERNSLTSAKNVLEAFINEVEAQGCETYDNCPEGKHLTPEGHALLKYNARYLIDRL